VTVAARLAALDRDPLDLIAECEQTQENADAVLLRWERDALPPEERARRLLAEHLRLVNYWCQLDPGLTGVRRLSTTPPTWELIGPAGTARATSSQIAEWRYAKVKLWDATGQVPELIEQGTPPRPMKWARVWKALADAAEAVELGDLGTDSGQVREWLSGYRDDRHVVGALAEVDDGCRSVPYREDGHVHVFSTDLLQWLRTARSERINPKELRLLLHGAGVEHVKVNVRTADGSPSSTTVYRLPRDWW
jgi:hypothetical protein